ncbi:MAG: DNA polymerase I [Meiothermus sp.]
MQQPSLFNEESTSEAKKLPTPDRIWLIDGHHLAYRSYFAFGATEKLSNSRGEPTQAVFGFLRTLLKLLRDDGDCVIVVFDAPAKTFRHESYAEYKAGRAPTPDDFRPQLEHIKRIVDLMGLKRLQVDGVEADDVIGSLARKAEREGYPVRIATADRDSFQLVSEQVQVVLPDGTIITPEKVKEKYGVEVAQWVDYRALVGDSSDNLPGAKGIGEKTAAKLLQDWGSLEGLYEHLGELSPKVRASLEDSRDNVQLSHTLSRIQTDVALDVDFRTCHRRDPDRIRLREELERLEFGSILREMNLLAAPVAAEEGSWPPPKGAFLGYTLDRAQPMWAELTGLGAADDEHVYRAPTDVSELKRFPELDTLSAKDLSVYALCTGLWVPPGDDPLLLAYLYDPSNSDPASTARRYGAGDWTDDPVARAQVAQTLWHTLQKRIGDNPQIDWLYREIEKPLSSVLARMEATGIMLNAGYLTEISEELGKEITYLEAQIHRLAGHPFNLGSRDQLETVLYDELKLGSGKKTTTGKRSTAASVLEDLRADHEIVDKILQYRELTKLKNTYLDPLPKLVHPRTGRLHTRFNQTVAATGRLSSSDPNLQNIPVRTEIGRRIRKGFVAAPGMRLVAADYSQIELRLLAHMSGDENLKKVFQERADIHTQTAAWMFGLKPEAVKPDQRRAAKTINFGVLYGMSAHRLSGELGISYAEASEFIERYFAGYPQVKAWIEQTLAEGREKGYVETIFGRKRFVPDLGSRMKNVREAAERMAFNMPVQGTAADLIKLAMVHVQPKLEPLGAYLVLQVHDELVVEAPEAAAEEAAKIVQETMRDAWKFDVPLEVGVGIGENWLEAK